MIDGVVTFHFAIPEENKREERDKRDDKREEKKIKSSEFVVKSS